MPIATRKSYYRDPNIFCRESIKTFDYCCTGKLVYQTHVIEKQKKVPSCLTPPYCRLGSFFIGIYSVAAENQLRDFSGCRPGLRLSGCQSDFNAKGPKKNYFHTVYCWT